MPNANRVSLKYIHNDGDPQVKDSSIFHSPSRPSPQLVSFTSKAEGMTKYMIVV